MYRLHCVTILILLTATLAGAGCKSNSNKPAAQQASAAKPSPTPSRKLIKTSGWVIPGLTGAKEMKPPRSLPTASNAKVYSSWLSPPPRDGKLDALNNYLSADELKELGEMNTKNPYIEVIVKYDVGGRPFCYVIKYRSVYTIEGLHYYDEDGDERFELLETGTPSLEFVPRVPGWAQQQQ